MSLPPEPLHPTSYPLHVVALAGGVGGAKMAHGLAQCLPPENLTVVVNIGDDFDHLGLRICPDLDTVCYTLAGLANPSTGWGRSDESWRALESLETLGGPAWFRLGDRDLGTHLERTRRLHEGQSLSQITQAFCRAWGIRLTVLPVTDDSVPTWVYTDSGEIPFQDYFVKRQCQPRVKGFRFANVETARPAPGVIEAISKADLVVICPSNPWVSVDPILAIPGMREAIVPSSLSRCAGERLGVRAMIAISPIIGEQTVKGPAAKMYAELGIHPSALAVANHYAGLVHAFVLDTRDVDQTEAVQALGIHPFVTNILMPTPEERCRLAKEVLQFGVELFARWRTP